MTSRRLDRIFSWMRWTGSFLVIFKTLDQLVDPAPVFRSRITVKNKGRIISQLDLRGNTPAEVPFALFQAFPNGLLIRRAEEAQVNMGGLEVGAHLHAGDRDQAGVALELLEDDPAERLLNQVSDSFCPPAAVHDHSFCTAFRNNGIPTG